MPSRRSSCPSPDHGPTVRIVSSSEDVAEIVAARVVALTLERAKPFIGLATGRTFEGGYRLLRKRLETRREMLAGTRWTHLDEFLELGPGADGSMVSELRENLLDPLGLGNAFLAVEPGTDADPGRLHRQRLQDAGAVHLWLLGIGTNGHVAFNEPGTPFHAGTRPVELSEETRADNAARFASGRCPARALTVGPLEILSAGELLLCALGSRKAEAVARMLEGPVSRACPASLVRLHPHATVLLDAAAASALRGTWSQRPERLPDALLEADAVSPPGPVAVIAPHPDDASVACGGLLAALRGRVPVTLLQMTTGARAVVPGHSAAQVAVLRERECREEARILGADVSFLRCGFYDSGAYEEEDAQRLRAELGRLRPAWVLAPSARDSHPTHALSRRVADEALREHVSGRGEAVEIWTWEGPWHLHDPRDVNAVVRLRPEHLEVRLQGTRAHASQVRRVPFDAGSDALARLRGVALSERWLGGDQGISELPLVEAYVRETLRPVTGP